MSKTTVLMLHPDGVYRYTVLDEHIVADDDTIPFIEGKFVESMSKGLGQFDPVSPEEEL